MVFAQPHQPAGPASQRGRQGRAPPTVSSITGQKFLVDSQEDKSKSCLAVGFRRTPKVHRKSHAVVREESVQHTPLLKASEPAGLILNSGSWADTAEITTDDETSKTPSPGRTSNILHLPVPSNRHGRRAQLYEGEREPEGTRGQEAAIDHGPQTDGNVRSMRNFSTSRRGKLYDGEQEPEGTRGQEAVVDSRAAPPTDTGLPSIRDFSSGKRSTNGRKTESRSRTVTPDSTSPRSVANSAWNEKKSRVSPEPSVSSVLTDERSSYRIQGSLTHHAIPEVAEEDTSSPGPSPIPVRKSFSTSPAEDLDGMMEDLMSPPSHGMMSSRQRQRDMAHDSTTSSEDIRRMMPDLAPTRNRSSPYHDDKRDSTSHVSSRTGGSSQQTLSSAEIESRNAAAVAHVERGEYDKALVAFGVVLQEYVHRYGKKHSSVASTYHNLGMVHSKRASMLMEGTLQQSRCRQQSLECFQAASRTARDSLGRNHPNVAVSLVRIGFLLLQARQYQNAIVTFQEALRIRLEHYGQDKPHGLVANLYNNLGVCHMHLGIYDEGQEELETALQIQRKVLHVKRQDDKVARQELRTCLLEVADTLCNVGGLHLEWVKRQGPDARHALEGEKAFAEALEIRTTVLGPDHSLVQQVQMLHNMAKDSPLPAPVWNQESEQDSMLRKSEAHRVIRRRAPSPPGRIAETSPELMRKSRAHRIIGGARRDATVNVTRQVALPLTAPKMESPTNSPSRGRQRKSSAPAETNIWLSPHEIPRTSPKRPGKKRVDDAEFGSIPPNLAASSGSDSSASSSPRTRAINSRRENLDGSIEVALREPYQYDAEESCLISDSGGISERATANFLSMIEMEESLDNLRSPSHEIMVVRPYEGDEHLRSPKGSADGKAASKKTSSWSGAVRKNRQGAVDPREIESAKRNGVDSPAVILNPDFSLYTGSPVGDKKTKSISDDYDDGIAPLGGDWPPSRQAKDEIVLRREMLARPHSNLNYIYDAAAAYLKRDQFQEALHLFQTVLDCQRRVHGELHSDVGAALHNVGIVYLRINRHEKALEYFEKASRVRKGSLGKDHHEVAISLVKVGICYLLLHNFEMALHSFHDALTVRRHSLGALHPATARVYNNIGCVHVEFNELRDARRAFEAALDVQRNSLCSEPDCGPLMFGTATTLCNLGYLYRYRNMPGKAVMVLKEALGLQESLLEPAHPTVLSTMDSLAEACSMSGSCAIALRYYNEILERCHSTGDADGSLRRQRADAILLYKMARVYRKQNDKEAELDKLHLSLKALRGIASITIADRAKTERLERRLVKDIRRAKEELDKMNFDWV